jgi:hypothetical protein
MSEATDLNGIDIKIVDIAHYLEFITETNTPLQLASLELSGGSGEEGFAGLDPIECVGQLTVYDTYVVGYPKLLYVGNLTSYNVQNLDMGSLLSVNGTVNVTGTNVISLHFDDLVSIGGSLLNSNNSIEIALYESLVSVGGDIILQNNPNLNTVNFSSLTTVGNLEIFDNDPYLVGLEEIEISSQFQKINDLVIYTPLKL